MLLEEPQRRNGFSTFASSAAAGLQSPPASPMAHEGAPMESTEGESFFITAFVNLVLGLMFETNGGGDGKSCGAHMRQANSWEPRGVGGEVCFVFVDRFGGKSELAGLVTCLKATTRCVYKYRGPIFYF